MTAVQTGQPLLAAQRELWTAQQMAPESAEFICAGYLDIEGAIDFPKFERAFDAAVAEASNLWMTIAGDVENPHLVAGEAPTLAHIDLTGAEDAERTAMQEMTARSASPVDLTKEVAAEFVFYTMSDNRSVFYMRYHHLLCDGFGQVLLWNRIAELYNEHDSGGTSAGLSTHMHADLVADERDLAAAFAANEDVWAEFVTGRPWTVELPSGAGPAGRRGAAAVTPAAPTDECASRFGARWSTVLTALIACYLRRITDSDNVVVGFPTRGRHTPRQRALPAMFSNELPLFLEIGLDDRFVDVIQHVDERIRHLLEHQKVRGETILRRTRQTDPSVRRPNVVLNVMSFSNAISLGEATGRIEQISTGPVRDLAVDLYRLDGDVRAHVVSDGRTQGGDAVARHAARIARLLRSAGDVSADSTVAGLDILPESEIELLRSFNATDRTFPQEQPLAGALDQVTGLDPDTVALSGEGGQMTRREVADTVRAVAGALHESGVKPGDVVGVLMPRSARQVCAVLGIMRLGAVYLPLDPSGPSGRLEYVVADSSPALVLSDGDHRAVTGDVPGISYQDLLAVDGGDDLPGPPQRESPAYLVYTSGSTGRPKGVVVSHAALWNRLQWMKEDYGLDQTDVYLQKTNPAFDVALWETVLPVITGARLHCLPAGHERDPRALAAVIDSEEITVAHFVPTMLDAFLRETRRAPRALRHVFSSGEALRPGTVETFLNRLPGVRLHNLYGPTEAAIDVTAWTCGRDEVVQGNVPIGRPVANTRISVVDERLRLVPVGVPGELCIHGIQLADGYLGRPELNSEKFVQGGELGERTYRTGDIVRWTEDGVLEYLGRSDHQVKIRGHRVELGEIEAQIQQTAGDIDVAVIPEPGPANDRLIAFVAGASRPFTDLREELRRDLPDYMIPVRWIAIDAIPVLPNGKRDTAGLQASAIEQSECIPAASGNGRAAGVQRAFSAVLACTFVGPDDNFFALGGDSMRAVRLRSVVEDELNLTFAIEDLYTHPTPAALAPRLGCSAAPDAVAPFSLVSPADRERLPDAVVDAYPLTSMQQGILYQFAKDQSSTVYRVVTSVAVPQQYDAERLRRSCDLVFERHPQLRISVDLTSYSEPLQLVHATVDIPIDEIRDLEDFDEEEVCRRLDAFVDEARSADFDLERPPLIRFAVHPLGPRGFQLTAVEHHVVLDGWSDVLLIEEIVAAFGDDVLPSAPVTTFADYVALERQRSIEPTSREFWSAELHDARLPQIFGRRPVAETDVRNEIARFPIAISAVTSEGIQKLASRHGVSLRTVFVAAHVLAVAVASGQNDVLTGVIANARPETADADRLIGVFLNTLPLHVQTHDRSVSELFAELRKWDARVVPHRYVPFGILERDLRGDIHLGDLPTYVNFMDFRRADYQDVPVRMNDVRAVADTNFPAAVDFLFTDDAECSGWIDGNLGVFSADELSRLAALHERALEALTTVDSAVPVRSIDLLDADEITELTGPTIRVTPSGTVLSRIEESIRLHPAALAVSHRDGSWTYAELARWSDRYAEGLLRIGVRQGDAVAVHLPRGRHLVAAILGVFKAGGYYIPLDPGYPVARLATIVDDAAPRAVVTDANPDFLVGVAALRPNDLDLDAGHDVARTRVELADTAYVIYTSGSTGIPKGVQITHRNLANFLAAMDGAIGCAPDDVMLAATSLSFDISVLELLWPLTTGAHVVVADDQIAQHITSDDSTATRRSPLDVSLFFFAGGASDAAAASEGYRLLLDAARFADTHGFRAVWTPERHFDPFGGLYPNPALTSAALATITSNVHLRSGSVVAPLHDPLRLAEEWAVVDQLSGGRIGLAFAPGWNSNDFALAPSEFGDRKTVFADRIDEFSRLWRGEPSTRTGGSGEEVELVTYPRPVQPLPELWLTTVGTEATFIDAGRRGVNILTHLFGQDLDTLTERIRLYRSVRAEAGHDGPGTVTLMLHTYLGATDEEARSAAREPFRNYLRGAGELWRTMFASTGQEFPQEDAEDYLDAVIDIAIDRYYQDAGLFGAPETRIELVRRIQDAGVDEVAALIDFGVPRQDVISGLDRLHELFSLHRRDVERTGHSLTELCRRYGVTMFQATPSVMSVIVQDKAGMAAMANLRSLLVGGEQFPSGLAAELVRTLPRTRVYNMYGPTETTIWSAFEEVRTVDPTGLVSVGRPIANTTLTVLSTDGYPVPTGVVGELWIGGEGVSPGYLRRPELTQNRFCETGGQRLYRTGDLACLTHDGKVQVVGRLDRQVKVHGQRVELDEIEGALSRYPGVAEAAVVLRDSELVAYLLPHVDAAADASAVTDSWSQLWDGAYTDAEDNPYAGWTSSYTDQLIPSAEMDEWVRHTVGRICETPHRRVLEIGVGTGLIMRGLAGAAESYLGVDISVAAIEAASKHTLPGVEVELRHGDATALQDLVAGSRDVVVLNSVIQYFPSIDYLASVLDRAVELIDDAGAVFVGDVRSFEDLELFYLDVELSRAAPLDAVDDVRSRVAQRRERESELCVAPRFFRMWAEQAGVDVEFRVKRTAACNEMSLFRYDVVVRKSCRSEELRHSVGWSATGSLRQTLERFDDAVTVIGVPNPKLAWVAATAAELPTASPGQTVWDLERTAWSQSWAVDPDLTDLEALAAGEGRTVELVPHEDSLQRLDLRFGPKGEA